MNEKNMNPEQIRQQEVFKERERITREAYYNAQNPTPEPIKERLMKHKAGVLRKLVDEANPGKPEKWKEARLRSLLGLPEPKQAKPVPATVRTAFNVINERIAKHYGIKSPGGIQYR